MTAATITCRGPSTRAAAPDPGDFRGMDERGMAMWRVFGIALALAVLALLADAALRPTRAPARTPPTTPAGGPSGPPAGSPRAQVAAQAAGRERP